jgi:hypothetical protein
LLLGEGRYWTDPFDPEREAACHEWRERLKARGYDVVLYPFILMDVPPGNTLPNPYSGTGQAAYPWRGRITCHPAAGIRIRVYQLSAVVGRGVPAEAIF